MKALILAGGKGSRLAALTKGLIPKPMAVLCGKPILLHAVERLRENGITELFLSLGHLHEVIEDYFGDGTQFGVHIRYIVENEPLGSGGALFYLKEEMDDDFVVCPGDAIFDVDFARMAAFHKEKNSYVTMFVHPNLHPYDSDLIISDASGKVTEINYKNSLRDFYYSNAVNAGILMVSPRALSFFDKRKYVNMEKDFVSHFVPLGKVYAYKSAEYVKDVGTPERFALTEQDIKRGLVAKKNLSHKQKAVFLDRDGTLNKYKGFITNADEIELVDDAIEAVRMINKSEYLAIVVSNQPVIARGEATFAEVEETFAKIETLLGNGGAYLDGIFYCPHHPHKGYKGEIAELKIDCDCRKPKIGLLKQAEQCYNLDMSKCVLIGDSNRDVETAQNAGIPVVKVRSELCEEEKYPACRKADSLLQAVKIVLGE
ncbi:MAG: HAD-IIIA family hydrolase [Corallococcus sp.]|nr:HAD-IIIA family hydrolase [Corallococcus sp.]MCM1359596.1 HAD-IIIA family hydrolase [Corallococcus sp.]MCM1395188.1 HAD-IIIA family hydrolase [Corallococcus sp.]